MSDTYVPAAHKGAPPPRRSRLTMLLVLAVCAAPLVAAAIVYFMGLAPSAATNYGDLVQPQRPVPAAEELRLTTLDGEPFDLRSLYGKWVMVSADTGACGDDCAKKLFIMRQTHASTGKDVSRIDRVWLITDDQPVPTMVLRAYDGMRFLRADAAQVARFLALPPGQSGAEALRKHIWLIDPRANQMMRFPENPDPFDLRKDIGALLKNSRIG